MSVKDATSHTHPNPLPPEGEGTTPGIQRRLNGCRTTRIYCRENCPPGRRTLPRNRVTFASEAAAIAAGYRACKVCKPDRLGGPWQPKATEAAK